MSGRILLNDDDHGENTENITSSRTGGRTITTDGGRLLTLEKPLNKSNYSMVGGSTEFGDSNGGLGDMQISKSNPDLEAETAGRDGWDNKVQFLLSVIGYAVGLGNIWRFPYLCQQNGGGAFLIPYCIMMFIEGMPVFLLEMGIGQRLRTGSIGVWNHIHPYLGGVGISSAIVSFLVALYYNVIITWCLFYLAHSFQEPLPWKNCPSETVGNVTVVNQECDMSSETTFFWYREAIDTTESISDFGGFNWRMVLCLIAAWFIVWACVCKGIKSSGKVMYITATFPYLVTTIFFFRSVFLEGAGDGLLYMITPQMDRLADPRVWLDAATQIFYSLGLAFGGLIAFSSYNPIKNNVKRDVLILSATNLITSMFSAIVIFCILGYKGHLNYTKCLAKEKILMGNICEETGFNATFPTDFVFKEWESDNFTMSPCPEFAQHTAGCDFETILKDAAEGTGLAFIVFAQAMVEFPGSQFWAVMFFLMLLSLGLGSMFGTLEGVITSLHDLQLFPWLKKPILTAILCSFACLTGLLFVTRAGEYWVKLFDTFAGSYGLMAVAFFEVIGVVYIYGWERFSTDIEYMTGERPGLYWQLTWRFVAPIMMALLFVSSIVISLVNPPTYMAYNLELAKPVKADYPPWSLIVAGLICFITMAPVPFVFFVRYFKIYKFESNIPQSVRNLNTTMSTMGMLKSIQSFGRLDSQGRLDRVTSRTGVDGEEVTYTARDPSKVRQ